jgi:deoxyribose-phosphate aldolase
VTKDGGEAAVSEARCIADLIDLTLLKPEATHCEINKLCSLAREYRFAAVCVNGCWVRHCAGLLRGTGVRLATVVGFPLGATTTSSKAWETRQLVEEGAEEIDMVAAIGHIKDEAWDYVERDISGVVQAAGGRIVKVILETAALDPVLIVKAAAVAKEAGAHFVKTSTGLHSAGGATSETVALLRAAVGDSMGVKAAGGIRTCADALRMIRAGATRIGTSSGVQIAQCLDSDPKALRDLLRDPKGHEQVCSARR